MTSRARRWHAKRLIRNNSVSTLVATSAVAVGMKRVLILTASFGEGHNSAARAIHDSVQAIDGASAQVSDLYALSIPKANAAIKELYSLAINHFPRIWQGVFVALDQPGLMESMLWTGEPMKKAMDAVISEFRPDVIVSTYPLYAYLFRRLQRSRLGLKLPFYTVITDSVGVNTAWHRCLSDGYFVADPETGELLASRGISREILFPLGFPVAREYANRATEIPAPPPWKFLYMPSTQLGRTMEQLRALLAIPDVELTVIAGRNIRIFDAVNASGLVDGERCQLVGWTDAMPQLLAGHHAFIGKAGGAIVQEALASQCPFLVSHFVPGQEEGNIALIERLNVGMRAYAKPGDLAEAVREITAPNDTRWKLWRSNLANQSNPGAADRIAEFVVRPAL